MTRIMLRSTLCDKTGYGNDGIDLCRTMADAGIDVRLKPFDVVPPLPPQVCGHFMKTLEGPFDCQLVHVWPDIIHVHYDDRKAGRVKIGWTMWEYTNLDEMRERRTFVKRIRDFDLLLAYDPMSLAAFTPYADEAGTPMQQLQGGFMADDWQMDLRARDWSSTFRFGMVGMLHERKNPFAAIKAFKTLKDRHGDAFDAELHLKTNIKTLHPAIMGWCPGIKIHYDVWPKHELKNFYAGMHTLLAPSWGEGKNLPCLEAQAMGVPVIVSDVGGHQVWGPLTGAVMLPGELVGDFNSLGVPTFRVDEEALTEAMWNAYEDRAATRQRGELAARTTPAVADWSVIVRKFMELLPQVQPKGDSVLTRS